MCVYTCLRICVHVSHTDVRVFGRAGDQASVYMDGCVSAALMYSIYEKMQLAIFQLMLARENSKS